MILKKLVGCKDCKQQHWAVCPDCKKKATRIYNTDGKRIGVRQIPLQSRHLAKDPSINVFEVDHLLNKNSKPVIKPWYGKRKKYLLKLHPKRVVALILSGHPARCACCGRKRHLSFDHITPISRGGEDNLNNGQILCRRCNNVKDDYILALKKLREMVVFLYPDSLEAKYICRKEYLTDATE